MESESCWPVAHRQGWPDLSPQETTLHILVQQFNARSRNIKAVLVNQLGWDSQSCGRLMPPEMTFADIRRGTDVEFAQDTYAPFAESPLEVVASGRLCVLSTAHGSPGAYSSELHGQTASNSTIVADYASQSGSVARVGRLPASSEQQRNALENRLAQELARVIDQRLRATDTEPQERIDCGLDLSMRLAWDNVCGEYFLPAVNRAYQKRRLRAIA